MFSDVIAWLKLVALITIGFGVGFTVLMPQQTYGPLFSRPFFRGVWGLLGDFDTDSVYDYYDHDSAAGFVMPTLMFAYLFLVTVVLVNLLIAQVITDCPGHVWKRA